MASTQAQTVAVVAGGVTLHGDLAIPANGLGLVIFAHGSGSNRASPRNRVVSEALCKEGFGYLRLDLLTPDEVSFDERTHRLRFDVILLGARLVAATDWVGRQESLQQSPIGYFGASTGAAAALIAAAERPDLIQAMVTRSGRLDLAGPSIARVRAPTLLIVGGADPETERLNKAAAPALGCDWTLEVIPNADHLFEPMEALEEVARLSCRWFGGRFRASK